MRQKRVGYKAWIVLVLLLGAMAVTYRWATPTDTREHRHDLPEPVEKRSKKDYKTATLNPGRMVVLETAKGKIEFVLFEKDCPKATALITRLIENGRFDGVKFNRIEKNALVQLEPLGKDIKPVIWEIRNRLLHEKGAVGLARWVKVGEPAASVYIAIEPLHHLDYDFVTFGRVVKGLEVVERMRLGDAVKKARVRPLTESDRKLFGRVLATDAERRTE